MKSKGLYFKSVWSNVTRTRVKELELWDFSSIQFAVEISFDIVWDVVAVKSEVFEFTLFAALTIPENCRQKSQVSSRLQENSSELSGPSSASPFSPLLSSTHHLSAKRGVMRACKIMYTERALKKERERKGDGLERARTRWFTVSARRTWPFPSSVTQGTNAVFHGNSGDKSQNVTIRASSALRWRDHQQVYRPTAKSHRRNPGNAIDEVLRLALNSA